MEPLSQKSLTKKLDKIFSEYIRRSRARNGVARCITCRKYDRWEEMDAGHYISRMHLSTRYDERNVHPQCKSCNRFHEGRKDEFALFLLQEYGKEALAELNKAKWQPTFNFPFEEKILHYKQLVKELKKA